MHPLNIIALWSGPFKFTNKEKKSNNIYSTVENHWKTESVEDTDYTSAEE